MRILRALFVCGVLLGVPLIARADLWINVKHTPGDTYGKSLWTKERGSCSKPLNNGAAAVCSGKGTVDIYWAPEWNASRDAECVVDIWPETPFLQAQKWHMNFYKNERGMCTAKWANQNTLEVEAATQPDYILNILGPANRNNPPGNERPYSLSVNVSGYCRNADSQAREVRCSGNGTVSTTWLVARAPKEEMCTVRLAWLPWPVNGIVPYFVNTGRCTFKKVDKTHGTLTVAPPSALKK